MSANYACAECVLPQLAWRETSIERTAMQLASAMLGSGRSARHASSPSSFKLTFRGAMLQFGLQFRIEGKTIPISIGLVVHCLA